MIRLALVGSRNHNDYETFSKHVKDWIAKNGKPEVIISGGAHGLDAMARRFAREEKYSIIEYLPNWKKYKKRAGPIRNKLIVDNATDMIAFPLDGPGTKDSIEQMRMTKKEPVIIEMSLLQNKRKID